MLTGLYRAIILLTGTTRANTVSIRNCWVPHMLLDVIPSVGTTSSFSLLLESAYREPSQPPMGIFPIRDFPDIHPNISRHESSCVHAKSMPSQRVPHRTSSPWEGAQCWHTCAVRHCPRDPIPNGRRPRHLSCNARPHHDIVLYYWVAHLGHKTQEWWRANTMPPPILHFEQFPRHSPA